MKIIQKLLSAVTAAAIGITATAALFTGGVTTASAADMTAVELVEDMGLGWNLGNALDSTNTWTSNPSPSDIETAWGNVVTTEAMIKEIKKAGFNTVRIPVTWWDMTGTTGTANMDSFNGEVAEKFLARVKEVVDYCINNGMYAIINTHHDEDWQKDTSKLPIFEKLWGQIAEYFKDYDEHLVFEGMNEVSFTTSDAMTYNQAFVDTVRATGGNNVDRLLICTANSNNTDAALSDAFSMPDDPSDMLAVSVHYYEPPQFCVADMSSSWGHRETWGTSADLTLLTNDFNQLKSKFTDNGVGVVIGEYGVCNADKYGINDTNYNKDQESIELFLQTVASTAYNMDGICPIVWDDSNSGTITLFNRENLSWFDESIQQIYMDIAGGDIVDPGREQTDRVTLTAAELDDGEGGLVFDLKPYKDYGVNVSSVVVQYEMTSEKNSAECSGDINMSFNVIDETGEVVWAYLNNAIGPNETVTSFEMPIGESEFVLEADDDGNVVSSVTGTLDMDYLKFENWWTWSVVTGDTVTVDIQEVTVIFDGYFYADEPVTTSEGDTTTTEPEDTTTTEDATSTEASATTTLDPDATVYGNIWVAGQAGAYQFWESDADGVLPVSITGNGTYTASYVIPEGDGTGSIECLILDSDINLYQFLPEDYDGDDRVTDCGVTFDIESVALDGVEIEYTGPSEGSMSYGNDGVSLCRNILNTWTSPSISDIDGSEVTLTQILEVTFTVSGLPTDNETTTTEEETTTTEEITTTEETTTTEVVTTTLDPDATVYGNIWVAGQAGAYQFWESDADGVLPVAITGNGTYTASYVIPEGDGTGSIECLILDSDINLYQFLPEDYDGDDRVTDCGVTFDIESVALDGVEIEYTGPSEGSMSYGNDGVSLCRNILNTWTSPSISDIDGSEVTLTQILEVTFTVSGLPTDNETTTTEEETTTTTEDITTTTEEVVTTTTEEVVTTTTEEVTETTTEEDITTAEETTTTEATVTTTEEITTTEEVTTTPEATTMTTEEVTSTTTEEVTTTTPEPTTTTTEEVTTTTTEATTVTTTTYPLLTEGMALGDINLDNTINMIDVVLLAKITGGIVEANDNQMSVADTNADGDVNTADVNVLLQYVVQQITVLPATDIDVA